jgi:hypothetical protein
MSRNQVYTFEFDQPTYVGFKYRQGKPYQSPYGDGFTYALTNGCVAFFPPSVDKEIQALNLGPRESCIITRRKDGAEIAWEVERAAIQPNDGTLKVENLAGGSAGENRESLNRPVVDSLVGDTSKHCVQHNTPSNGSAPPLCTRESPSLYRQLVAAIEAVKQAEAHSVLIGYPVKFQSEDIRAMAISGFIQQAREGY